VLVDKEKVRELQYDMLLYYVTNITRAQTLIKRNNNLPVDYQEDHTKIEFYKDQIEEWTRLYRSYEEHLGLKHSKCPFLSQN